MDSVKQKLDSIDLIYPNEKSFTNSNAYDVRYYYLSVPAPYAKERHVRTGYSIALKLRDDESGKFSHIDCSGFSISRDDGFTGFTGLAGGNNYKDVDKETAIDFQDKQIIWSTYREYPYTESEKLEAKGQPTPREAATLGDDVFTVYYAYVDVGDARYTITLSDIAFNSDFTATIKDRCLEESRQYFTRLFEKENVK
ncbi:hypothetical protein FACS18949_15060 [Clostridia bacterium]|nr:hypothetical protein FACS189425_01090 [Clostridia bacterium]GHV36070.1 hypothetical protein FACS18949_15060 [Clostridia bacterium]